MQSMLNSILFILWLAFLAAVGSSAFSPWFPAHAGPLLFIASALAAMILSAAIGIRVLSDNLHVMMTFILSSLLCISVPVMSFHLQERSVDSCRKNRNAIRAALDIYASDNGGLYPPSLNLLTPSYVKSPPLCPAGHGKSYDYERTGKSYRLTCKRKRHGE